MKTSSVCRAALPSFLAVIFAGLTHTAGAADPVLEGTYFDEATMRHLTLQKGDFGSTRISVRFAMDPGSSGRWDGNGQSNGKQFVFARTVGEGEDRGTYFVADVSESKVEIGYRPGQKEPMDAGINGTYRRASEAKVLQLAKKEFQAANERLVNSLKNGYKTWAPKDKPALAIWKDQWAAMRQKWMDIAYQPAGTPAGGAGTATPPATPPGARPPLGKASSGADAADKPAAYWFKLADATARGYYFVESMPDPKTGTGWDGEYDDFAGGHVSLRLQKDGRLRANLSFSRAEDTQTGTIDAVAPAEKVVAGKVGELTADFVYADSEVPDAGMQAKIKLTKIGRYLRVETQQAERYGARGWFDGIYRGAPVPAE